MAFTPVTLNTSPSFSLVTLPFPSSSDATCDTTSGDATVAMDSTSAISAEMNISGTGIPANTKVLSITNSTTFEMTKNATASNTNTTLTFTGAGNAVTITGNIFVNKAGAEDVFIYFDIDKFLTYHS